MLCARASHREAEEHVRRYIRESGAAKAQNQVIERPRLISFLRETRSCRDLTQNRGAAREYGRCSKRPGADRKLYGSDGRANPLATLAWMLLQDRKDVHEVYGDGA